MKIRVSNGTQHRDLNLPMSDYDLNRMMRSIGVNDTVPYCTLSAVWDDRNPLVELEGLQVNMDEVNYFAKAMDRLTDYQQDVLSVYVKNRSTNGLKDFINLTFSIAGLSLITDFSEAGKVGRQLYMDEFQALSAANEEKINFIEFAEKTFNEDRVEVYPYGVFVEHGFEMQEIYNGKTFPMYLYDPEQVTAVVELQGKDGATEYLYLPTTACSFDKVKARLGAENYSECKVTAVHNERMPENLLPKPEDLKDVEQLAAYNELCQTVCRFDDAKMDRLSLAVAFIGTEDYSDRVYIAKNLDDFEIVPNVHNDEEYGRFVVVESGLFDVDELIQPHIDYAAFAKDKRSGMFADSEYVDGGFIGTPKSWLEYLNQYHGEYSDPLEFSLDDCETFYLYSPLKGTLMSGGEYSEQEDNLYRYDLIPFESDITEAVIKEYDCIGEEPRGLMHYFSGSLSVAEKVFTAKPMVTEREGELYGVLECRIREALTADELDELKEYWTGQMSDGWGEGFEQQAIKVEDGELYVSFWSGEDSWSVMTEEELSQSLDRQMGMGM